MSIVKNITINALKTISPLFPINLLTSLTNQRLLLPVYHTVNDTNPRHIKHLYPVRKIKQFERDLDFFLKHYKPIDYFELEKIISTKEKIAKNIFHLSFDDGLSECSEIIAPILLRKGIPATFFLNSSFIDNKDLFFRYKVSLLIDHILENKLTEEKSLKQLLSTRNSIQKLKVLQYHQSEKINEVAKTIGFSFENYLATENPYMSSAQINQLISQGFTIGAHSCEHPEYQYLKAEEQIKQTKDSIEFITERFNLKYRIFAFPFTDYGVKKDFFDEIFKPENALCNLTFGCAGLKRDSIPLNLQRIPIEKTTGEAQTIIPTEYLYYLLKSTIGKNVIERK